jgi:hypothetical protein
VAPPVAFPPFQRVAQRVPVVQDLAQVGFSEVGCHHVCLHPDRAPHQLLQHRPGWVQRRGWVGLDQLQDHRIGDEPGLDHLRHPGDEFGARQRLESREIRQHRGGFVECSDQVLARIDIDSGLTADRRVHHPQQRGGHVDHPNTT